MVRSDQPRALGAAGAPQYCTSKQTMAVFSSPPAGESSWPGQGMLRAVHPHWEAAGPLFGHDGPTEDMLGDALGVQWVPAGTAGCAVARCLRSGL